MNHKPRAFTLIEIVIVLVVVGILTVSVTGAFGKGREKSNFIDNQNQILNYFQIARTLAMSNKQTANGTADYYKVQFMKTAISLRVQDSLGESQVDRFDYTNGVTNGTRVDVYFFAPAGNACFDLLCSDNSAYKSSTLSSDFYSTEIRVYFDSGFAEVVNGEI